MNAKDIHDILTEVRDTSSTNDKKEILKKYSPLDPLFQKYLTYVYDEVNFVYGKSKIPEIPHNPLPLDDFDKNLEEMFGILDDMNSGELKGNSSDEAIIDYCVAKPTFYEDLLFYVIKRDLKTKTGSKIINEVFGRIIPIAPYMRCESESYMSSRIVYETDNVKHGALAQSKADGAFLNVQVSKDDNFTASTTRYGRDVPSNNFLDSLSVIPELMGWDRDKVIHGELLLKDVDGTIMDRQTGNGKINKYAKRVSTLTELRKKLANAKNDKSRSKIEAEIISSQASWDYIENNLVYEVWDTVPFQDWINLECNETTIVRFNEVIQSVQQFNDSIKNSSVDIGNCELRLIDYKIVHNADEAMEFYQEQLDAGLEGMVIKNLYAKWKHDTNRDGIIKLKDFKENDLIILGYNMADEDSTFAGGIGSLIMESSDGLLKVNVSGMKRHDRGLEPVDPNDSSKGLQVIAGFDFDQFTGKIAAVKYNEVIKSKSNDFHSMFLPNVLEVRDRSDKTQADDFIKIKKDAKYKGK